MKMFRYFILVLISLLVADAHGIPKMSNHSELDGTHYPREPTQLLILRPQLPRLPSLERATPIVNWIVQPVDHFNSSSNTFQMRYSENNEFYEAGSSIFIMVGGEGNMDDYLGYLNTGLMYDIAKNQSAYLMITEHRYYGQSIPNGNLQTSNLRFLTVEQALEDLATFIRNRTTEIGTNKVVLFGGSYPASLATWFREVYPNLATAAVAASGVFDIQVDNIQYQQIVQKAINNVSTTCLNSIKNAISTTERYIASGPLGRIKVKTDYGYNIFADLKVPFTRQDFFNTITLQVDDNVQYDQASPSTNIRNMCASIAKSSTLLNDYTRFSNYDRPYIKSLSSDESVGRPWTYQICTQIGNFITTNAGSSQPFGNNVPLSYYNTLCNMQFGFNISTTGIQNLKQKYGGLNPNVTKVVFTEGPVDPWSGVGLTHDLNPEAPVIIIDGSSHAAVLLPASTINSSALASARARIQDLLWTWVQ